MTAPPNMRRLIQFAEIAGRPTTFDGEALNALRSLRAEIERGGRAFADYFVETPEPSRQGGQAGDAIRAALRQKEAVERQLADERAETSRLKARIGALEEENMALARRASAAQGSPAQATAALRDRADRHALEVGAVIEAMGLESAAEIARTLNAQKVRAPRGGKWSARQVHRLRDRLAAIGATR